MKEPCCEGSFIFHQFELVNYLSPGPFFQGSSGTLSAYFRLVQRLYNYIAQGEEKVKGHSYLKSFFYNHIKKLKRIFEVCIVNCSELLSVSKFLYIAIDRKITTQALKIKLVNNC